MGVIKPKLHHVTFKTSRLDEMVTWYGVLVGAKPTFRDKCNAWMTNDEANHRIAFLSAPGLEDDPRKDYHNCAHHSAFEYDNFSDLMSSYKRLSEEGIHPAFCLDHGLTISIYYKDPDGNFVELQSDNFGDWKLSTEFMRTSADFQANPIGTFFDPQKVYEAHQSGIEFKTLQKAIRAGEYAPAAGAPEMGLPKVEASRVAL
jgi:catechol 2,3-dioxygenase